QLLCCDPDQSLTRTGYTSTVTVTVFPLWKQRIHKSARTGDTCSRFGSAAKDIKGMQIVKTVRRSGWTAVSCLAAALLVGACSSSASTSPSGSTTTTSGPPLVIGISMSLSGDFADLASPALKGYELWAATVNANGGLLGRKVSLKGGRARANPTRRGTNYENRVTADDVH